MPNHRPLAQSTPIPRYGRLLWWAAPPLVRMVGRAFFSLRIEREAAPPPPPFVVAANHYSHFDPPLVAAALDLPVRFLTLDDLFEVNWLMRWLLVGFAGIPVPRDRRPVAGVRAALARIRAGEVVGVFPEASRASHWGTVPSKRGAAWLAMRTGVPLVPVAVMGTGRVFGLDNRLHVGSCRVVVGQAMSPGKDTAAAFTHRWEGWITSQISRYPESEPDERLLPASGS